jgi:queuine tRNA-ribosyltransferase
MKCGEILGPRLATIHNLYYYQRLMRDIRAAIAAGSLAELADAVREAYRE